MSASSILVLYHNVPSAGSFVGALNDNYEGGELVFWKDYSIKLKKGEVLCFPSNFLYQHRVNPILNGVN